MGVVVVDVNDVVGGENDGIIGRGGMREQMDPHKEATFEVQPGSAGKLF